MKKLLIIVVVIIIAVFAYWTISPFFTAIEKEEAMPTNAMPRSDEKVAVVDTPSHPGHGFVKIVEADGKTYIRYEDYETLNGPDIFVYLAKDLEATEFISLGAVKTTKGSANYEVPAGVNLSEYPYVLTWCRAFGVLFNSANISSLIKDEAVCVQVITPARNPQTGIIQEFPTPCDVPEGWEVIQNDIPTL